MKNLQLCKGLVVLIIATSLWTSCQKEISSPSTQTHSEIQNQQISGVLPDDPAAVAKVPLIVSSDFLAHGPNFSSIFETAERGGKRDIIAPLVSIISPASGVQISGIINITVNASDNIGVKSVSLSVDGGIAVSTSTTSPFTNQWNSGTVANGTHTLTVTASDGTGNKATNSIQVSVNNVTVGDIISPAVNYISPSDQSAVTGTVNVSINATDNVGVSSVSISIDDVVVSTSTSYSWNTSNAAAGFHTIKAVAKDAAGNQGSGLITVSINTIVVPPPPPDNGIQLTMPAVGQQGGEGSCVAFAVGYATRSAEQFYRTNAGSYNNTTNVFSPEFLYNQVKASSDCGSGTSILKALDFIVANGICTFQSMPYSYTNGCSLMPTGAQLAEGLNYKISGYSKVINTDRSAIKTMIQQKHPLIIMILADYSFQNATAGFIWKTYSGSGNLPHSIAICGYDDSKNAYKVMNSWGTAWGDAGYSWIDYGFFETGGRISTYCYAMN